MKIPTRETVLYFLSMVLIKLELIWKAHFIVGFCVPKKSGVFKKRAKKLLDF
jgi:hypothetical protein